MTERQTDRMIAYKTQERQDSGLRSRNNFMEWSSHGKWVEVRKTRIEFKRLSPRVEERQGDWEGNWNEWPENRASMGEEWQRKQERWEYESRCHGRAPKDRIGQRNTHWVPVSRRPPVKNQFQQIEVWQATRESCGINVPPSAI